MHLEKETFKTNGSAAEIYLKSKKNFYFKPVETADPYFL